MVPEERKGKKRYPRRAEVKPDGPARDAGDVDPIPEVAMEPVDQVDIIKKILVIGDSGVGKKTILGKVAPFNKDWERYTQTIGTAITKYGRNYSFVTSDVNLLIIVWDVTGQHDYQHLQPSYYRGAEGIVVMADANDRASVDNISNWVRAAYKITDMVPTVVVINKMDLVPEDERKPLDRRVRLALAGYDVPVFYITKDADLDTLKVPFHRLAELLTERIRKQLAKRRYRAMQEKDQ